MIYLSTRARYIFPLFKGCCDRNVKARELFGFFSRLSSSVSLKSGQSGNEPDYVSIAHFYAGKSVFITGGNGFLGKMYIQKLLYSCPDINKIYLLVRANSRDHALQRVTNMVENSYQLFKKLQQERPKDIQKIVPVLGDLGSPNLGIDCHDEQLILDEVSIVVHAAATVKFNDQLKTAYNYNVKGTNEALNLAKRMKNIQAFLHISTLYSITKSGTEAVDEILYPPPVACDKVDKLLENYGHLKHPPLELLGGCPNTYTFTKALAETLVGSSRGEFPIAIIRPSIVATSKDEPYKGWIDHLNPHSYFVLAVGKGIIRCIYGSKSGIIDIVPVDYVANLMIVAPTQLKRPNDFAIYNCGTSGCNPLAFERLANSFIEDCVKHEFNDMPFPKVLFSKSILVWRLTILMTQVLPSYIVDAWLKICGKQTSQVANQQKVVSWLKNVTFFTSNSWKANSDHVNRLFNTLDDNDKRQFPFDLTDISWDEYLQGFSSGTRYIFTQLRNKK